jgi:hypothetical protein
MKKLLIITMLLLFFSTTAQNLNARIYVESIVYKTSEHADFKTIYPEGMIITKLGNTYTINDDNASFYKVKPETARVFEDSEKKAVYYDGRDERNSYASVGLTTYKKDGHGQSSFSVKYNSGLFICYFLKESYTKIN